MPIKKGFEVLIRVLPKAAFNANPVLRVIVEILVTLICEYERTRQNNDPSSPPNKGQDRTSQ